ncbi:single-stranded DNA-binding protein, partial [bacterium]|nr:single-stranded DNA-binding protein [bacterium]
KHSVAVESMQMLDSKSDAQSGMNSPMGYEDQGGSYAPQQGQPQSYQQPTYGSNHSGKPQQPSNQKAQYQSREMPSSSNIPEIDIDEDEIPF